MQGAATCLRGVSDAIISNRPNGSMHLRSCEEAFGITTFEGVSFSLFVRVLKNKNGTGMFHQCNNR